MKIIVFTGSRAELFLQLPLWITLSDEYNFEVNILASYTDNNTRRVIKESTEKTNLKIIGWIDLSKEGDQHSYKISKVLHETNQIDVNDFNAAIVFADRYESFGFAISLSQRGIPLIHLEAGDITKGGTFDDNVRHAITALSSIFITTNKRAVKNLLKINTKENRIMNCGIFNSKNYFFKKTNKDLINTFDLNKNKYECILVFTYHPLSNNIQNQINELKNIKKAFLKLSKIYKIRMIVTGVNADIGGKEVNKFLSELNDIKMKITFHETLGASNYLGLMSLGLERKIIFVGNSSSIVKEVPFFPCKGVLIGRRQLGRELGSNTFLTEAKSEEIKKTICSVIENYEKKVLPINPYYVKNSVLKAANYISTVLKKNSKLSLKNIYVDLNL